MKSTNNLNSGDPSPEESTAKDKIRPSGEKDKAESEKCEAEGLPKGWTKEIKVTKKGREIRRDPYYTDPVSGYVFRSMKDALHYVKTGDIGKLAIKPKEKTSNISESEFDGASLPAAAKKQKLEVNGTTSTSTSNPSSNLPEIAEKHLDSAPGTKEVANGEERSQSKNSGVLENKSSNQKAKSKRTSVEKSKENKDLSLPRRTSKRLSSLPLDHNDTVQVSTGSNSDFRVQKELEVNNPDNGKFDFAFAQVWTDPCIEFAIKTLTGDIPLDCGQQHKENSSQSMESGRLLQNNRSEIFSFSESGCKNLNIESRDGVIEAEGVKGRKSGCFDQMYKLGSLKFGFSF